MLYKVFHHPLRISKPSFPTAPNAFKKLINQRFDAQIEKQATVLLHRLGICTSDLNWLGEGANATVFAYKNKLAVKVLTNTEHPYSIAPDFPLVTPTFAHAVLGYDMGQAPIELKITPLLQTKKVTPLHVEALCYKSFIKYGFVFFDNKLENVGLSKGGIPFILDGGAFKEVHANEPLRYFYPEYSGYDQKLKQWKKHLVKESPFLWPEKSETLFEFQEAKRLIEPTSLHHRARE